MTDFASPNLRSRDFRATSLFHAKPGFVESWRDDDWMILERGDLLLAFFQHPGRSGKCGAAESALREWVVRGTTDAQASPFAGPTGFAPA